MKSIRYIKFIVLFMILAISQINAKAPSTAQAEKMYAEGMFEEALQVYQSMAKGGESAELYYNMANCYFRLDSIPQALLWFERAYLLNPGDSDIRYNLQYARTKTIDKIVPEEEIFFVRWYRSLLNMLSVNGWTIVGIICFALCLIALCMYLFIYDIRLRKLGFYGCICLFAVVLLSNLFAWQQQNKMSNHDRAIIFASSISCMSSPNQAGKELYLLHEGTTVNIIDSSVRNWLQVRLPDGKQGWIPATSVEVI